MTIDDEIMAAGRRQADRPVAVPEPRQLVNHRRRSRRAALLSIGAVPVLVVALVIAGNGDEGTREAAVTANDTRPGLTSTSTTVATSSVLPDWAVDGGTVPHAGPPPAFEYRRDGSGRVLAMLIDGRTMAISAGEDLPLSEGTPRVTTAAAYVGTGDAFELTVLWGTIDQHFGGRPIRRVIDRGAHGGLLLDGGGRDARLVVQVDGWTVSVPATYMIEDRQDLIVEALAGSVDPSTGFLRLTADDDELELDYTNLDDSSGYMGPVLRLTDPAFDIHISPARCVEPASEESPDGSYVLRCDPDTDLDVRVQTGGPLSARDVADGIDVSWLETP